jgi:transcriptional regulator with XRE-family HTH domain
MERSLGSDQLRSARRLAGLTQQQAADRLRVSQAYLALLERGRRPVTVRLASRIASLYRLGPLALPLNAGHLDDWDSCSLAAELGSLGYPYFRRRTGSPAHNPANILLGALAASDIEVRIQEALPWLAAEYNNLDWEWLIREAKVRDLQNRLGFIVTLARRISEKRGHGATAQRLYEVEEILERARLVREDTLCQASLSDAERKWLRQKRPVCADHWNLLTDLSAEALPYAA